MGAGSLVHTPVRGVFFSVITFVPRCSANRANPIYNHIFARSRTLKCAKLGLGASAVHVRSRQQKKRQNPIADDVRCVGEGARARGTAVKTALERRGWS